MEADMFKKYAPWVAKASECEIIDGRAMMLLGDSAQILKHTKISADRVITDPPYDFASEGGKTFGRDKSYLDKIREADITSGFDTDILINAAGADSMIVFMHNDQLYKIIGGLTEPRQVISQDSLGCSVMAPPIYPRFVECFWHKDNPMPVANKHYVPDTEIYIHCWRQPFYPQGELQDKGRYIFAPVSRSIYDHPTVKPQSVMRKCVTNGSMVGDVILDPFAGSGSTGVAALALGRYFIGIEQNKEFFDMAVGRLKIAAGAGIPDHGNQQSLFNT